MCVTAIREDGSAWGGWGGGGGNYGSQQTAVWTPSSADKTSPVDVI